MKFLTLSPKNKKIIIVAVAVFVVIAVVVGLAVGLSRKTNKNNISVGKIINPVDDQWGWGGDCAEVVIYNNVPSVKSLITNITYSRQNDYAPIIELVDFNFSPYISDLQVPLDFKLKCEIKSILFRYTKPPYEEGYIYRPSLLVKIVHQSHNLLATDETYLLQTKTDGVIADNSVIYSGLHWFMPATLDIQKDNVSPICLSPKKPKNNMALVMTDFNITLDKSIYYEIIGKLGIISV